MTLDTRVHSLVCSFTCVFHSWLFSTKGPTYTCYVFIIVVWNLIYLNLYSLWNSSLPFTKLVPSSFFHWIFWNRCWSFSNRPEYKEWKLNAYNPRDEKKSPQKHSSVSHTRFNDICQKNGLSLLYPKFASAKAYIYFKRTYKYKYMHIHMYISL